MEKRKNKSQKIEFTESSGNIYADMNFPNPEEAKTKAELAILITKIIKEKCLNQHQAAELMGIDQPKVSKIVRGILSEFSIERLMKFVLLLGYDIEIRTKQHRFKTTLPSIHVAITKTPTETRLRT